MTNLNIFINQLINIKEQNLLSRSTLDGTLIKYQVKTQALLDYTEFTIYFKDQKKETEVFIFKSNCLLSNIEDRYISKAVIKRIESFGFLVEK